MIEDEAIIGRLIVRHLRAVGHHPFGPVVRYEEALSVLVSEQVDLVLLDINLGGLRKGTDIAEWLNAQARVVPHAYLSSEERPELLQRAQATQPIAFLFKPVRPSSLRVSIDIVLRNLLIKPVAETTVSLTDGRTTLLVSASLIRYLHADHVYLRVATRNHPVLVCRYSLQRLLSELNSPQLVQTHRSYAVNLTAVTGSDDRHVFLGAERIPLSRRRRPEFRDRLAGL